MKPDSLRRFFNRNPWMLTKILAGTSPTTADDEKILEEIFQASPAPPTNAGSQDQVQNLKAHINLESATAQFEQWACEPNSRYRPTCRTTPGIPPGVYNITNDDRGFSFNRMTISTDSLIVLDDTASQRVVEGIRTFWQSRETYRAYELVFKRGILLWGPAGSGKTATLMLMTQDLLEMGGMVVVVSDPNYAGIALGQLRQIEPDRPLILILEDIDELIKQHGEHQVLALLDGEYQIPNVVCLATTNYPERLGPRIINRPSRFDERVFVDTPNSLARERYLRHITKNHPLASETLQLMVEDTPKFSIAHLRELVIATRCLGQDYEDVLRRLKSMQSQVKALPDYPSEQGGFLAGQQGQNQNSRPSASSIKRHTFTVKISDSK